MKRSFFLVAMLFSILLACAGGLMQAKAADAEISPALLKAFSPLPQAMEWPENPSTEAKVNLGRMLYYEPRLSKGQDVSCNSCHALNQYGVDGKPVSSGYKNQKGSRNAPTVYNAAAHFVQFWDGRAPNVEEQAKGPMLNPVEMALPSGQEAVAVLRTMPEYVQAFQRAFPDDKDPVTFENMAMAIGAFERGLVTPSRWDDFLNGNQAALNNEEKAGLLKFTQAGCQSCHAGALVGGNKYQKLGLVEAWTGTSDLGRYQVTNQEGDKLVFKVPSLRNIEKTAPYFHDGSVPTLEQAVRLMGKHELGKQLSDSDVDSIVAWLKSLTGPLPASYIKEPQLPKSTAQTPQPDRG
jgi:cytochrome c peroxidase